jgi:hypothetical protein
LASPPKITRPDSPPLLRISPATLSGRRRTAQRAARPGSRVLRRLQPSMRRILPGLLAAVVWPFRRSMQSIRRPWP